MKLIKPKFEIITQQAGEIGMLKHIEIAKRVCYKSEDKITEDSYKKAVQGLIDLKHGAMLEHGTVYLKSNNSEGNKSFDFYTKYLYNKYSVANIHEYSNDTNNRGIPFKEYLITTNYRVLVENGWLDDLQYQCEPTEYHEKRITVKFTCDRGISHEFVRNRGSHGNAFAQESTRYCNYSQDKFGNELTFIIPNWINLNEDYYSTPGYTDDENETPHVMSASQGTVIVSDNVVKYLQLLEDSEDTYNSLIEDGWKPQQARAALPNSLKTELIMTCTITDWKHFFFLRTSSSAHPQARELAIPLEEEFKKRGLI